MEIWLMYLIKKVLLTSTACYTVVVEKVIQLSTYYLIF